MAKRVSIKDVANMAGVSPGTVSNFLNQSAPVNKKTKENIQNAIDTLGYRRDEIASSLRRAQTKTIGLLLPDIRNPFYADFYYSVENEARENGYNLIFGSFDYKVADLNRYMGIFSSRRVDGIIISTNYNSKIERELAPVDAPVVIFEPSHLDHQHPVVGVNNQEASVQMINYLMDRGHEKIGVVTPSRKSQRYLGYEKAFLDAGKEKNEKHVFEIGKLTKNLFQQGFDAMEQIIKGRTGITACYFISDMLAIGAMSAAKKNGLKIPDDMAIAGFDNIPFSEIVEPGLTTIEQPVNEMGKEVVNACMGLIEKEEGQDINALSRRFSTRLIKRISA